MEPAREAPDGVNEARQTLIDAETEYRRALTEDYITRLIRDDAIVEAHRTGLSSREISEIVGDMGQPNVVRARRRAATRREVIPGGLLSPADAVRSSGLPLREFVAAVREGRITPVPLGGGVRAFKPEDAAALGIPTAKKPRSRARTATE
ncbi:MAG: hypothetical protein ACLPVY_04950 [Acidimicrobiia bacterium]